MIRELLHPGRNKLAVAASVALVLALTAIGVLANNTRERQDRVEHTFSVEHVQVTKALCGGDRRSHACRDHALNLLRACLEFPRCARLLNRVGEVGARSSEQRSGGGAESAESPVGSAGTSHNSSRGLAPSPGPGSGSPQHHPEHQAHHHPSHFGHPHPAPEAPSPAPTPTPTSESSQESAPLLPTGPPLPGEGKAKGLAKCAENLEVGCAAGAAAGVVEGVAHALSGDTQEE